MDTNQHELISQRRLLRLAEARSGARVYDPQCVAVSFMSMGFRSWFQNR